MYKSFFFSFVNHGRKTFKQIGGYFHGSQGGQDSNGNQKNIFLWSRVDKENRHIQQGTWNNQNNTYKETIGNEQIGLHKKWDHWPGVPKSKRRLIWSMILVFNAVLLVALLLLLCACYFRNFVFFFYCLFLVYCFLGLYRPVRILFLFICNWLLLLRSHCEVKVMTNWFYIIHIIPISYPIH